MRDNAEQLVPDLHHGGTTPVTPQLLHTFQGGTPVHSLNNSALWKQKKTPKKLQSQFYSKSFI